MGEQYYPFDSGAGFAVTEDQWRTYSRAMMPSGFVGRPGDQMGKITAGTGAQLVRAAAPRGAMVDGHFWRDPDPENVAIPPNTNTNPRIDRAVIRLDPSTNTVLTTIIQGVPAGAPVAPALTQSDTGIWDLPLAQYQMPGSASAQNPTNIIDERVFTTPQLSAARIYGSGASINSAVTFNEPVPVVIPAIAGTRLRITFSVSVVVDGNSAQAINLGAVTTGLTPDPASPPADHHRTQIPPTTGLIDRRTYWFSWVYVVNAINPTFGLAIANGTGPNRLVCYSSYYDINGVT